MSNNSFNEVLIFPNNLFFYYFLFIIFENYSSIDERFYYELLASQYLCVVKLFTLVDNFSNAVFYSFANDTVFYFSMDNTFLFTTNNIISAFSVNGLFIKDF